ncbi:MAG: radical SAM protein [Candidatus Methanoperedens sp.]|nr:radical SAM protein [Candidatus Methanoperedens sp.]
MIKRYFEIINGVFSNKVWRLNVAVTDNCNSQCIICNVWKNQTKNELTIDDYCHLFKTFGSELRWLHITGGEPFLRKDLYEIISCAIESCSKITVIDFATNGFSVNNVNQTMKKLVQNYPSIFFEAGVSMDGRPHVHESIRNIEGCWEKTQNTWSLLRELSLKHDNFKVHINFTINPWNTGEIRLFLEEFPSLYPISVSLYHTGSSFNNKLDIVSPDFHKKAKADISWMIHNGKATNIIKKLFLRLALQYLENPSKQILHCEAGNSSLFLDPQGNVYLCSIGDYRLGNIREEPSLQFLNSNYTKELKNKIHKGLCSCWSGCECWPSILKHMPAALMKSYGNIIQYNKTENETIK